MGFFPGTEESIGISRERRRGRRERTAEEAALQWGDGGLRLKSEQGGRKGEEFCFLLAPLSPRFLSLHISSSVPSAKGKFHPYASNLPGGEPKEKG
jgi:hypothetical protein